MAKKRNQFNDNIVDATSAFLRYFNHLVELAITMFEWKNLPEGVDERYLELGLFEKGGMVFFEDADLKSEKHDGYLALNFAPAGTFDMYGVPIKRRAYSAYSSYSKYLGKHDSVIIWNNYLRLPSWNNMRQKAMQLADLEAAISVNCKAQKTPVLIRCDENERLSLVNMYMQYEGNYPFIFGEKALSANSLEAINTGAPFVARDLYEIKTQIWNEALTELGISNVSYQKKERMVRDEAIRNMGGTIASRYSRLEMRRKAAEEINKMFGLDIEVNFREDYREADDETMFEGQTGDGSMQDMVVDLRTQ